LGAHRGFKIGETGGVAARTCEARHQAAANGIGYHREYDRNCASLPREGLSGRSGASNEHVRPHSRQLGRKGPDALRVAAPPTVFNPNITTLHPPQVLELALKGYDTRWTFGVGLGKAVEYADESQPFGLRACGKRIAGRRAPNHFDEIAPSHWCLRTRRPCFSASNFDH